MIAEQSVGHGAAGRADSEVKVGWPRPGQRSRWRSEAKAPPEIEHNNVDGKDRPAEKSRVPS